MSMSMSIFIVTPTLVYARVPEETRVRVPKAEAEGACLNFDGTDVRVARKNKYKYKYKRLIRDMNIPMVTLGLVYARVPEKTRACVYK